MTNSVSLPVFSWYLISRQLEKWYYFSSTRLLFTRMTKKRNLKRYKKGQPHLSANFFSINRTKNRSHMFDINVFRIRENNWWTGARVKLGLMVLTDHLASIRFQCYLGKKFFFSWVWERSKPSVLLPNIWLPPSLKVFNLTTHTLPHDKENLSGNTNLRGQYQLTMSCYFQTVSLLRKRKSKTLPWNLWATQ